MKAKQLQMLLRSFESSHLSPTIETVCLRIHRNKLRRNLYANKSLSAQLHSLVASQNLLSSDYEKVFIR